MNDLGSIPDDAIPAVATASAAEATPTGSPRRPRLLRAGRLVGLPDRDGLRARRRRHRPGGGGADLRRQGAAALQPADRASRRRARRPWPRACSMPTRARLAEAFWPGPLTLVVPAAPGCRVCDLARAGLPSVALRVPAHPLARALLARSAGPSPRPPPTARAASARPAPTTSSPISTAGSPPCSTAARRRSASNRRVVACLGGRAAAAAAGRRHAGGDGGARSAAPSAGPASGGHGPSGRPGLLASHYAPRAQVRLEATAVRPDEAALLFGPGPLPGADAARARLNLSPAGDLAEAAARLFSALRRLDARRRGGDRGGADPRDAASARPSTTGLRRAAAPR